MERAKIGIAISSFNRPELTNRCLYEWKRWYPKAEIIVVDDCSTNPPDHIDFRFEINQGVAKVKNACIDLLLDRECDHLFLVDNDIFPVDGEGLYKYVNSNHKHMSFTFTHRMDGVKITDELEMCEILNDNTFVYTHPLGCMLYFDSHVFDTVKGYDENYGMYGFEHVDISLEVHENKITERPFMDIPFSLKHFYSYDFFSTHDTQISCLDEAVRVDSISKAKRYFNSKWNIQS